MNEQDLNNTDAQNLEIGGIFKFEQIRDGKVIDSWEEHNIVVNESLNYILDVAFSAGSANTAWYVGLFKNNFTPIATSVMSTFPGAGVANESTTDYSETTRPVWTDAGAASQSITNSASPAAFTFTPASTTIYGAFLSSSSVKGGTTGVLGAASKFASSRTLLASDVLNVTYTLNISST